VDGTGESGTLVDATAIFRLLQPGAERCERRDHPKQKGGARRERRDEQHAFNKNYDHLCKLRPGSGSRDCASGSPTIR
jgi:hypothetical protein